MSGAVVGAAAVACVLSLTACGDDSDTSGNSADSAAGIPEGTYKDGDYHNDGGYKSPGGQEKISVDVSLKDGAVSGVTMTYKESNPTSGTYLKKFSTQIGDKITGVPLKDVEVDKVAGASGTSKAFMESLKKIADDARD